jgi:hypothetical protein
VGAGPLVSIEEVMVCSGRLTAKAKSPYPLFQKEMKMSVLLEA